MERKGEGRRESPADFFQDPDLSSLATPGRVLRLAVRGCVAFPALVLHLCSKRIVAGHKYRSVLRRASIRQNVSRAANWYDKAIMESCPPSHNTVRNLPSSS